MQVPRPAVLPVMALALSLIGGCGRVVETKAVDHMGSLAHPACRSTLGAYFLPKKLLVIDAKSDTNAGTREVTLQPAMETVADRAQMFCLDYLESATSQDIVTVDRDDQGLLQSINSSAEDRTPTIVQTLAQTAVNAAIAGARTEGVAAQTDNLSLRFDPFNWDQLMEAKEGLRRFGYCLYVEGYSFSVKGLSEQQIRRKAARWCNLPASATPPYDPREYTFANLPVPSDVMDKGVLYRPTAPHKVVLLRKEGDEWQIYQTKQYDMPNASPVLAIGIKRAMFAKRETSVKFSHGILTDIAVNKGSELVGFVSIPLVVAKAIVDVPTQIIQIKIADAQGAARLVDAQGQLLTALAAYDKLISGNNQGSGRAGEINRTADIREGQFIGACQDAGGNPETCANLAKTR